MELIFTVSFFCCCWSLFVKSAIITYHSLDESSSAISVTPRQFEHHIRTLAESETVVVPLDDVVKVRDSVALTFDDAFANFADHALPVLERYGLPATVFVVTRHCGRTNSWTPAGAGIPVLPLMSWDQIRRLPSSLISVGGHTQTHPDLTRISTADAVREISGCRLEIESELGRSVRSFAYPFGKVNAAIRQITRQEYDIACGTELAHLDKNADLAELPRLDAYYYRGPSRFESLVAGTAAPYTAVRRILRAARSFVR